MKKVFAILGLLCCVLTGSVHGQTSVMRTFAETGGSVSTGNSGDISSFSNGDLLVVNERWTNFSQKGIQMFRLREEGLSIIDSRAYFNDFTITNIRIAIRNDSVFIVAQHNNGGIDKLLFLVFDSDLDLVLSKLIEVNTANTNLYAYSFFASADGSFRIYGNINQGTNNNRFVISLDARGQIIWDYSPGLNAPLWGGSVLLPNGTLIGMNNGDYFAMDKNGGITRSLSLGKEFSYTLNGVINRKGEAMFCRGGYDSTSYYAVQLNAAGDYAGVTASAFTLPPVLFEALPNGFSIIGSSSFAGNDVNIKLSLFEENGQFSKNLLLNNVYGYAPTGALRDACRYSSHVDAKGNLMVLGVANRRGFFVFRYNPSFRFECGHESTGSQPSPVPEISGSSCPTGGLNLQVIDYPFQEETPGTYKPECMACGSALVENLFDTSLCLDLSSYVLDAKNEGSRYLWSDGSTGRTLSITESGTYWVHILNECDTLSDTVQVKLSIRPKIQLSYSPENPMPGEMIQLGASPDTFLQMNWYAMDTLYRQGAGFSWSNHKNGSFEFIWEVYNDSHCRARDSLTVKVSLIDYYFPNAFSPNNNGLNETWGPVGIGIVDYKIEIYNRWGQLVFRGENQHWDGRNKGLAVMDGEYIYRVELINDDGVRREYKGVITLLN